MNYKCQNCRTEIFIPEKVVKANGIDELAVIFCPVCDYPDQMDILYDTGYQQENNGGMIEEDFEWMEEDFDKGGWDGK